ncbi:MAG: SURF1 family protein, partial [Thiohalobacterales bacterium]|nr:SURF1 family protein [Thiohalobacterales bacterium]
MRIGGFEFRPGFWPTLVTLAIMPVLVGLGIWQLERAAWKQGLVDTSLETTKLSPQPLLDVIEAGGVLDFRPVVARGRYLLDRQLLQDNRIHHGRPGYHALTPLLLEDHDEVVLVNRGWLAMGQTRSVLPPLPGPEGDISVTGIIARLPEKVFRLDAVEEHVAGWPQVIQHVDFEDIERRLQHAVIPVVVLLDAADPHGFARDWRPIYGITPDKHRAYAMQWFTLALVLLVIYIGVNTRR